MGLAARRGIGIGDADSDARRWIDREKLHPGLMKFLAAFQIVQVERHLHHMLERRPRGLEHGLEVAQRLAGLFKRLLDHPAMPAGPRIASADRRQEQEAAGLY